MEQIDYLRATEMTFGFAQSLLLFLTVIVIYSLRKSIENYKNEPGSSFNLPQDQGHDPLIIGMIVWAITRFFFSLQMGEKDPILVLIAIILSTTNDMFFLLASLRLRQGIFAVYKLDRNKSWRWSAIPAFIILAISVFLWILNGSINLNTSIVIMGLKVNINWWLLPSSIFSMIVWIILTFSYVKALGAFKVERWLSDIFLFFQILAAIIQLFFLAIKIDYKYFDLLTNCLGICSAIVFCLLVITALQAWLLYHANEHLNVGVFGTPSQPSSENKLSWSSIWTSEINTKLEKTKKEVSERYGSGKVFVMVSNGDFVVGEDQQSVTRMAYAKFAEQTFFYGNT